MSKHTDKTLFIVSSMPRLYQRLLNGVSDYHQLGNRIIREIKAAYAFRNVEQVRELSKLLVNSPLREYQLIGQYYIVWCDCRASNYQTETLERIIEQTQTYKAQALLTRGTFDMRQGKPEAALYFYNQALKSSSSVSEFITTSLAVAQLKSIEGFQQSALRNLESLIPLIKYTDARLYYDFLNSYAVELNEAGRKEEARNVSRIVSASPFIHAYPEWQQTAIDVQPPNRSFAFVNPLTGKNVLRFRPSKLPSEWSRRLAKILIFGRPPGAAMKKKKDDKKQEIIEQFSKMTKTEKALFIRRRILDDDLPNDVIEAMLHILVLRPRDFEGLEFVREIVHVRKQPDVWNSNSSSSSGQSTSRVRA